MSRQLELWKDDGSLNFSIQLGHYCFFNEDKLQPGQTVGMPVRDEAGRYTIKQYTIVSLDLEKRTMGVKVK